MGPLLSLHLLLTVIGTMLFDLSCMYHYITLHVVSEQQEASGSAAYSSYTDFLPFTLSPCRKDPSPLLCPVLNMWCCLQRLMWCGNEGLGQDGHGCTQAVPRVHWHSRLQVEGVWEFLLSSSGYSAWAGFFWNSMYVRWIWTQIVLWNKLSWQHLHTFSAGAGTSLSVDTKAFLKQGLSVNT